MLTPNQSLAKEHESQAMGLGQAPRPHDVAAGRSTETPKEHKWVISVVEAWLLGQQITNAYDDGGDQRGHKDLSPFWSRWGPW